MAGSTVKYSYEDFEPFCKWRKEQGCDTLEVHLPGFKKNQLKIHLLNLGGVMTITGERPLTESKRSRFKKEIKLLKDYKTNEIHAKLSRGILYIVMPKNKTPLQTLLRPENQENARTKSKTITSTANVELPTTNLLSSYGFQVQNLVSKLQNRNVAIIVSFVIAVAAFIMYKYRQPSIA